MTVVSLKELRLELRALADPEKASVSEWFFKTGPGEYGEGDKFLGLRVPELRRLSRKYKKLSLEDTIKLLRSEFHEERQLSLFILILKFKEASPPEQKKIYELYLKNLRYVNNWDLVDCSAPYIVGPYLEDRPRDILYDFARSEELWERRVAILATHHYIKKLSFEETLKISEILLFDEEDLIQKAVGWMLREIGRRDESIEKAFLNKHYKNMPRTMLRYAIERLPENKRKAYLKGEV